MPNRFQGDPDQPGSGILPALTMQNFVLLGNFHYPYPRIKLSFRLF